MNEIGAEEFRKMVQKDHQKREGTRYTDPQDYVRVYSSSSTPSDATSLLAFLPHE